MVPTAKDYAEALCDLIERSASDKSVLILKNFILVLKKHRRLECLTAILGQVEYYYRNNKNYSLQADLEYAGINPTEEILKILKSNYLNQEIHLKTKENKKLIAGIKLEYQEKQLDFSLLKTLEEFRKN